MGEGIITVHIGDIKREQGACSVCNKSRGGQLSCYKCGKKAHAWCAKNEKWRIGFENADELAFCVQLCPEHADDLPSDFISNLAKSLEINEDLSQSSTLVDNIGTGIWDKFELSDKKIPSSMASIGQSTEFFSPSDAKKKVKATNLKKNVSTTPPGSVTKNSEDVDLLKSDEDSSDEDGIIQFPKTPKPQQPASTTSSTEAKKKKKNSNKKKPVAVALVEEKKKSEKKEKKKRGRKKKVVAPTKETEAEKDSGENEM